VVSEVVPEPSPRGYPPRAVECRESTSNGPLRIATAYAEVGERRDIRPLAVLHSSCGLALGRPSISRSRIREHASGQLARLTQKLASMFAFRRRAGSKRSGLQCRAPAVRGISVCRMHGARGGSPGAIRTPGSTGNFRPRHLP
jgi:hypothetical protein